MKRTLFDGINEHQQQRNWMVKDASSLTSGDNLQKYTESLDNELISVQKNAISQKINSELSPSKYKTINSEELAKLKECFQRFSTTKIVKKPPRSRLNANGVRQIMYIQPVVNINLSQKQLGELFSVAEMPLHKQTLSLLYTQLTKNTTSKGVFFEDLLQILDKDNGSSESDQDYRQIYDIYDIKKRGFFDYYNYKYVCQGISKELTQTQIREAFKSLDYDHSGQITFDKFVKIMKGYH